MSTNRRLGKLMLRINTEIGYFTNIPKVVSISPKMEENVFLNYLLNVLPF